MDINKVIAIVRRLREEPERTAEYKAMQKTLYPRGSTKWKGKETATLSNVGGFKSRRDKKAKRNRGYGAVKKTLMRMKEDAPTMSMGGGGIAGSVEANDDPPVNKKKKKNIYLGLHSRKRWLDFVNGKGSGKS